jgi:hypothetical protein
VVTYKLAFSTFILGLVLWLAPSQAGAQPYSVTNGTFRQFCCNLIPPVVVNDFPFAAGGGGVTVTTGSGGTSIPVGLGPAYSLTFDASRFGYEGNFLNTAPVIPGWISISTAVDFVNEAGALAPGGQTGSASYCFDFAGNPNCTDPGAAALNGRLAYVAGPNNFGGTMRILGGTPGFLRRTDGGVSVQRVGFFAAPLSQVGGPFSETKPETQMAYLYAVPNLTTPTATSTNPIVFGGLPWGTGMVYGQATGGAGQLPTQSFSYTGGDSRVNGLGNINLVSASMAASTATNTFPTATVLSLNVPEPGVTAMFAVGLVAAVVLGLRRKRS